jgi:hypothetical protein
MNNLFLGLVVCNTCFQMGKLRLVSDYEKTEDECPSCRQRGAPFVDQPPEIVPFAVAASSSSSNVAQPQPQPQPQSTATANANAFVLPYTVTFRSLGQDFALNRSDLAGLLSVTTFPLMKSADRASENVKKVSVKKKSFFFFFFFFFFVVCGTCTRTNLWKST